MSTTPSPFRRPLRWILVASLVAPASAQTAGPPCPEEPALQNWTGGGTVTCPCFVAGEEAGAVLNAVVMPFLYVSSKRVQLEDLHGLILRVSSGIERPPR